MDQHRNSSPLSALDNHQSRSSNSSDRVISSQPPSIVSFYQHTQDHGMKQAKKRRIADVDSSDMMSSTKTSDKTGSSAQQPVQHKMITTNKQEALLKEKLVTLRNQATASDVIIKRLKKENSEKSHEILQHLETISVMRTQSKKPTDKTNASNVNRNSHQDAVNSKLSSELKLMKENFAKLESTNKAISDARGVFRQNWMRATVELAKVREGLASEKTAANAALNQANDENKTLKTETGKLLNDNKALKTETGKLLNENSVLELQLAKLRNDNTAIDKANDENKALKTETGKLLNENVALKLQLSRLQNENTSLKDDVTSLTQTVAQAACHNLSMERQKNKLLEDITTVESEKAALIKHFQTIKEQAARCVATIKVNNDVLKQGIDDLRMTLETRRTD
ncbi:hypothetical protein QBC38DRAFT_530341 [Podospora fimiseda]|uniref:Uncharacterized protein n=1 Tax=Podospora fimiseda TaxID=252190 RepID=A0AAN7GZG7_9PEZI|nr:hypothetical protein QBC38DRAFT_530341 [Podospora fimiseda]